MKRKVKNSREHFTVYGFKYIGFSVSSRWFAGACDVLTYELNELLATKLRALYQRRKGRDLFDLAVTLDNPNVDPHRIVAAFQHYMEHGGHRVSRKQFEENLAAKLLNPTFTADMGPLLARGASATGGLLGGSILGDPVLGDAGGSVRIRTWDMAAAADLVSSKLIATLPEVP